MSLTRREMALAALAATTATAQQKRTETKFTNGLDRFKGEYEPAAFDTRFYSLERYKNAERALRFDAKSKDGARSWQKKLRAKLETLIGGLPKNRVKLNAKTLEVKDLGTHTREALLFDSQPGMSVFGYLLVPKQSKAPHAVVICLPGHGRGVDDIVGIGEDGRERTKKVGYAYDYAVQVAEHGMAALAIETFGFGCRRDDAARAKGATQASCQPSAGAALLLGETIAAWRIWDVMRACDYIITRKELDATRIGLMGISGGGMITQYAAALEPRIRAAFISCALCTFRDSIVSISHCIDNYVPGMLQWAESSDIAGLIAPRPLFVESGLKDPIFPIGGSRDAFEATRRVYEIYGVPELCQREEFDAGHEFHGVKGLEFLRQHLSA